MPKNNFSAIARKYFASSEGKTDGNSKSPAVEDVVSLDDLLLKASEDPEVATDLILIGIASAGFIGGGVELLTAAEIQRRLNRTAAVLEKQVGPLKTILRQAIRAGAIAAGSLAGFFAGHYEALANLLRSPSALGETIALINSPGNVFKLLQAPASLAKTAALEGAGRLAAAPIAGMTLPTGNAIPSWITNIPKKLKRIKHFSNEETSISTKTSDDVFTKLISSEDDGGFLFKALLAGLATLGVGTAGLGTYKLSSVISRARAVSKELTKRNSFLSTIKSGLMSVWEGPILNEIAHQVSTRELAAVAKGQSNVSTLRSPLYKAANLLS